MVGFLSLFILGANGVNAATYERTFTSRVMDNYHSSVDYGTISWGQNVPPILPWFSKCMPAIHPRQMALGRLGLRL